MSLAAPARAFNPKRPHNFSGLFSLGPSVGWTQLGKDVDATPNSPYVCVLLRAGETVGVDVFRRADLRKAEAAALALALVRLDCDSYEIWQNGKRIAVVNDKLAKASDLLFERSVGP